MGYWSWVLEGIGVLGNLLAGKKFWWSWLVLLANLMLWMTYGVITKQYGFVVFGVLYFVVYARNAYKWYHIRHQPNEQSPSDL